MWVLALKVIKLMMLGCLLYLAKRSNLGCASVRKVRCIQEMLIRRLHWMAWPSSLSTSYNFVSQSSTHVAWLRARRGEVSPRDFFLDDSTDTLSILIKIQLIRFFNPYHISSILFFKVLCILHIDWSFSWTMILHLIKEVCLSYVRNFL